MGTIVFLTAFSDDPQAVVFEVFESVCTALNKFHLPVEAFGDAIVFGEPPHTGDGLIPIGQGFGESFQWFEAAIFEGGFLRGEEVFGTSADSGEIASVVFDMGRELPDQFDEVLLDDSNDVESIGDDFGVGEVFSDQGPVGTAEIHADEADVFLAFKRGKIFIDVLRVTALDDIEDAVGA